MFVYKKLKASDAAITAFEAHKSYTTSSLYLGRYNSSSKDTFSQFNLNNELEYFQLDHLFYRDSHFQLGNLNGGINYINQEKRLYDKALIISIGQNQFGEGIQKGSITIDSTYKDDSKGNLYKSSDTLSDYPEDKNRVLYVGPVKGFKRTDLTRHLSTGNLLVNPPLQYSDSKIDDSLYVNPLIYDSASIEHFSDINCTSIQLGTGSVKIPHSNNFNFDDDDFTISFYYKSANTTTKRIIDKSVSQPTVPYPNSNGSGAPTEYGSQASEEKIISIPFDISVGTSVRFRRKDIDGTEIVHTAGSIAADTLYHIACVKTGSALQIWINGAKQGSDGADTTTICRNKADVVIGRDAAEAKASQIMIWNKGLNGTEIANVSESIDGTPYVGNVFYENGIITFTSPKFNDSFSTITNTAHPLTLVATNWQEGSLNTENVLFNTFSGSFTFFNREENLPVNGSTSGFNFTQNILSIILTQVNNPSSFNDPFYNGTFVSAPSANTLNFHSKVDRGFPAIQINPLTSSLNHTFDTTSELLSIFSVVSGSAGTSSGELGTDNDSHVTFDQPTVSAQRLHFKLKENQTVTESINITFVSNSQDIINDNFPKGDTSADDTSFNINNNISVGTQYNNLISTPGFYLKTVIDSGLTPYPWWSGSLRMTQTESITNENESAFIQFDQANYALPGGVTQGAEYELNNTSYANSPGTIKVLAQPPDGPFNYNDPFFIKIKMHGTLGVYTVGGSNFTPNFGIGGGDTLNTKIRIYSNGIRIHTEQIVGNFNPLSSQGYETVIQFPPSPNSGYIPSLNDELSMTLEFDYNGQTWPQQSASFTVDHFGIFQPAEQSPYIGILEAEAPITTQTSSIYYITCSDIQPSPNTDAGASFLGVDYVIQAANNHVGVQTDINGNPMGVRVSLWKRLADNSSDGFSNYKFVTQSFYPSGAYTDAANNDFHYTHQTSDTVTEKLHLHICADREDHNISSSDLSQLFGESFGVNPSKVPDNTIIGISGSLIVHEVSASKTLTISPALSDKFTSSLNLTSSVLFPDTTSLIGSTIPTTASIIGFGTNGTEIVLDTPYLSTSSFGATASLDRGNFISGSASFAIPEDTYGLYTVDDFTIRFPQADGSDIPLINGQQNVKVVSKINGVTSGSRIGNTAIYGNDTDGINVFTTPVELGVLKAGDTASFDISVVTSSNNSTPSRVIKDQGFYVERINLRRITSSNELSKTDGSVFTNRDLIDFFEFGPRNLLDTHPNLPFSSFEQTPNTFKAEISKSGGVGQYGSLNNLGPNTVAFLSQSFFITKSAADQVFGAPATSTPHQRGPFQASSIHSLTDQNPLKPGKEYKITFSGSVSNVNDSISGEGAAIRILDGPDYTSNILKEVFVDTGTNTLQSSNDLAFFNHRFDGETDLFIQFFISGATSDNFPVGDISSSITASFNVYCNIDEAISGSTTSTETVSLSDFLAATQSTPADTYPWSGEGVSGDYEVQGSTPTTTLHITSSHDTYTGIAPALSTGKFVINGVQRNSNGTLEVSTPLFITGSSPISGTAPTTIKVLQSVTPIAVNPFTITQTPTTALLGTSFTYTNPVNSETEELVITSIDATNKQITVNNGQGLFQVGEYTPSNPNGAGSNQVTGTTSSATTFTGGNVTFKNTHPIFENEYHCTVEEDEFNFTLNPTVRKAKTIERGDLANFATGSNFKPYVTTIGLYNEQGDLLVAGKIAQPIRMSDETDTTFIVKFDT